MDSRHDTLTAARLPLPSSADGASLASSDHYRNVVEALGEGVLVQNSSGVVLTVNRAAGDILEYDLSQLEGQSTATMPWPIFDENRQPIPMNERPGRQCIRSGVPTIGQVVGMQTKSGADKWIELDARPLFRVGETSPYAVVMTMRDITSRVVATRALASVARRHEAVLANAAEGYRIVDLDGNVVEANPVDDAPFDALDSGEVDALVEQVRATPGAVVHGELRTRRDSGLDMWIEVTVTNRADDPAVVGLVINHRDITERRNADRSIRFQALLLNAAGQAIVGTGKRGRVVYWNEAAVAIYGLTAADALGKSITDVITTVDSEEQIAQLAGNVARGESWSGDVTIKRPDGSLVPVLMTTTPIYDSDGKFIAAVGVSTDITERKRAEEELSRLALQDSLTGLWNRVALVNHLDALLASRVDNGNAVAVLFVGLDRFKVVNDAIGHQMGDQVLTATARRLEACFPDSFVARFGGDQFVVVCEDTAESDLAFVAVQNLDVFDQPFVVEGYELVMTASVGVANATAADTSETLLRDADAAMYRAKENGKASAVVFDDALRQQSSQRLAWETSLRQGLDRHEFRVVYQPVVALVGEQTVGFEALIRWDSPEHGLVSPAEFIPVAEDSGMIVPIGEWVLQQASLQLAEWQRDLGRPDLWVAVNLSTRQLAAPSLIESVADAVLASGIQASSLHLEITETAFMHDVDHAVRVLQTLRDMGVRIAVDDFGTGYSSLTYLKQLPIDTLKVDRSFVDGLGSDPHDSSIVRAIVSLGAALDLTVVAEGVETKAQVDTLRVLRCPLGQGYHWSPGLTPAAVREWMTR